jgi:ABC-2 type transport system ATP-binding protein
MSDLVIRTEGLTKRWRSGQLAVDDIALAVPDGGVYGFLGPNGSGKTTTIRMLLALITPTAGSIELLGADMPSQAGRVLPKVGALIEGPAFHPYLSGAANLRRLDRWDALADADSSKARIGTALDRVGLGAAANKRFRTYSLGMKQRLGIAAALLQPRALLVLDEPTNGLDPQGTREIRTLVRELAADGTSVLVSSHLLSEVEQICTHVGVMRVGSLVAQGSLAEVRERAGPSRVRVETPDIEKTRDALQRLGIVPEVVAAQAIEGLSGDHAPETISAALVHAGVALRGFSVSRPTLEDLFVALTGEGFDVAG